MRTADRAAEAASQIQRKTTARNSYGDGVGGKNPIVTNESFGGFDGEDQICAYQAPDTGRRCKKEVMDGGHSKFCENHTCASPTCENPKSSKEQYCEDCSYH